MDAYNINGYGYDLSDLTNLTKEQQETLNKLLNQTDQDGNDLEDIYESTNLNSNCLMAFPCNSDDFNQYIYLPDIPAVQLHKMNTHVYTIQEGQQMLTDFTINLFRKAGKQFGISQSKIDDLLKAIKSQIKKLASYNQFQDYC